MMSRWITWIAAGALLAVGLGAVFVSTVGLGDTQAATTSYLTSMAQRTTVTRSSAATGTVQPATSYSLAFGSEPTLAADTSSSAASDLDWTVDQVLVSVGDRVAAGQALATADTSELDSQLADLDASLELERLNLQEAKDVLQEAESSSQADLVDARSAVWSASLNLKNTRLARKDAQAGSPKRQATMSFLQAKEQYRDAVRLRDQLVAELKGGYPEQTIAVGQAEASVADLESQMADLQGQLALARLTAPVDGVVSEVNIEPGLAAPASAAVVVDSATLEIIADVVESDVDSLAVGQPAVVSIDALGLDVEGTVTSISPSTTGSTSSVVTFPVTVTLSDPPASVRSGMSSDVEITIAEAADVVAVPAAALSGSDGNYSVRVATAAGGVEPRSVSVGLVTESLAEIQSGVAAGEEVVVGTATDRTSTSDGDEPGFGGPGGFIGPGGLGGPAGFVGRGGGD
jgi:macrolide-specific efflux system membrane fusion protein